MCHNVGAVGDVPLQRTNFIHALPCGILPTACYRIVLFFVGWLKQISIMSKWTEEEIKHLMMCVEASDDETMEEMYEYVHHMMYKEGNHPDFAEGGALNHQS